MIIAFALRPAQLHVWVGIKASMCDTGTTIERLCLIAVNDQQCSEVT